MILRYPRNLVRLIHLVSTMILAVSAAAADSERAMSPNGNMKGDAVGKSDQSGTEETWTLERALSRAMEANSDLLAAKYDVERQEGARLQVTARMLPSVSVTGSLNQREDGLVDVSPSQRANPSPPSPDTAVALFSYDTRIEVRQLVFDGLSAWNAASRQRLLGQQSYLALRNTVARTVALVRQGFDQILLKTAAVSAEQRRVEEYVQLVEGTDLKNKAGEIPEFELLRAEAEMEGARADLAEAARALGQAEQNFRRLLQISNASGPLKLAGKFEPRQFNLPLDQAISMAKVNRPDLQSAVLGVEIARKNRQADAGGNWPRFEAFASYGARSSYYNSAIQLRGFTYGVIGQVNLFEGGAARGRQKSLRADQRSAETKLADTEQGVVSHLHELYQGLQQARVGMEAQEKSMNLSAKASHDARRQFDVGLANLEQVLQAGLTYRRAESRMNDMIYNLNAIVAEIEYSVGGQVTDSLKVPDTWKP